MRRFLVVLMCAMLMVTSVGMNAQATGTSADAAAEANMGVLNDYIKNNSFTEDEYVAVDAIMNKVAPELGLGYNETEHKLTTSTEATKYETEDGVIEFVKEVKSKLDACKIPAELTKTLEKYYKDLGYSTNAEKTKADNVMKKVAEDLGYTYASGKFTEDLTKNPKYSTVAEFTALETTTKAELDACKTKVVTPTPTPEPEVKNNSNVIIGGKEYDTSTANAGHHCEIAVPLVNLGETDVKNVVITPALSSDPAVWPFDIERTDYSQTCDELEGEDSGKEVLDRKYTFRWNLKTREDAITGYTKLVFNVTYNEADGTKGSVALDYYVQVNGVEPTEENGRISTPRVIVTGFTTTPEEVYAGDTFKLTLNLKNTSKDTTVSNMLFDIQGTQEGTDANNTYAAFLPTAGSSTIFVDSIGPNASKSISIELKSKADLAQKPYVVTVNMEYEDDKANPFTETATVSVPIKQESKVDLSSIQLMPENIEIGNEANVMFSIYNVGKTQLYNVNVKFVADSISGGEVFIGNMAPGATGNVDAYLMGQAMTMDDGTVKILISYEDEEGKEAVIEESMTLFVNEPYYPEMFEDPMMMGEMEEESKGLPWWGIVLIAVAVLIVAVIVVVKIRKKKKAKRLAQEEMELIEAIEEKPSEE